MTGAGPAIVVASQFPSRIPCELAIIGEAPSREEIAQGRPFVGPAGRVLGSVLRSAGIDRATCYVGNVYNTQLQDNSVSEEITKRGKDDWNVFHARNVARLVEEIVFVNPTVVVPLGATALQAMGGVGGISQRRGQPMMGVGAFHALKLLPTFHPSHILKQWSMFPVMIGDLIRAQQEAKDGPTIIYPKRQLLIDPTLDECLAFLERCKSADLLSCDIETGWGQVRGVSFAPSQEEAIYVPLIDLRQPSRSYWQDGQTEVKVWRAVKGTLESPVPKLGQNFANYDVVWLLARMGIRVANLREDTRLLHKALYPELPASLSFMSTAYSRQGSWKH